MNNLITPKMEADFLNKFSEAFNKPKYRYNWKTGEWDEVFRFDNRVNVISGARKPDGSFVTFSLPGNSPLADHYRKEARRIYAEFTD